MKVLVTGGRDYMNRDRIRQVFEKLAAKYKRVIVVHGDCPTGADHIADELAKEFGFEVRPYPADWDRAEAEGHRNSAGPKRNSTMIREEHPDKDGTPIDLCLAFTTDLKRSRGTKDCFQKAGAAGIKGLVFG